MEFGLLPNDDWLETSPSMEYTCKMSGSQCCGGSSEQQHQGLLGFNPYVDKTVNHWLPTDKKIVLSDSYLLIRKHVMFIHFLCDTKLTF
jgi:hypothetical protein